MYFLLHPEGDTQSLVVPFSCIQLDQPDASGVGPL